MRYSPEALERYPVASRSMLLAGDPLAWNLAWLSWDWENYPVHPDPAFTGHVHRTMQFVIEDGVIDVARLYPDNAKVGAFMTLPPPSAALKLLALELRESVPLYRAYGAVWLETVMARSHLYREPHDDSLDQQVIDTQQALTLLSRL